MLEIDRMPGHLIRRMHQGRTREELNDPMTDDNIQKQIVQESNAIISAVLGDEAEEHGADGQELERGEPEEAEVGEHEVEDEDEALKPTRAGAWEERAGNHLLDSRGFAGGAAGLHELQGLAEVYQQDTSHSAVRLIARGDRGGSRGVGEG